MKKISGENLLLIGIVIMVGAAGFGLWRFTKDFMLSSTYAPEPLLFLKKLHTNETASFEQTGHYTETPEMAFALVPNCPNEEPCQHYLYYVRQSCESGGRWLLAEATAAQATAPLRERQGEVTNYLEAWQGLCRPVREGYEALVFGLDPKTQVLEIYFGNEKNPIEKISR